ncbi:MAG: TIGR04076 family protein [Actinobacteria bacterium]|nr:TIGR04076 family protein [Actinomycetota bacterium]
MSVREFSYDAIPRRVVVTVERVDGRCAADLKVGDRFVCQGANLKLDESDRVCMAAFCSIYPMIMGARMGLELGRLGLPKHVVQCIDPGPPYTPGGTVYFKIEIDE